MNLFVPSAISYIVSKVGDCSPYYSKQYIHKNIDYVIS